MAKPTNPREFFEAQRKLAELRASKGKVGSAIAYLIFLIVLYVTLVASYIGNIVQLVLISKTATITFFLVLKVIGIFFPPLGIILGFLGFFGF